MAKDEIAGGVVHQMPADLRKALTKDGAVLKRWQDLTPLARNEWICWVVTNKKPQTRSNHIKRTVTEILEDRRRPCCWIGCIHRSKRAV